MTCQVCGFQDGKHTEWCGAVSDREKVLREALQLIHDNTAPEYEYCTDPATVELVWRTAREALAHLRKQITP